MPGTVRRRRVKHLSKVTGLTGQSDENEPWAIKVEPRSSSCVLKILHDNVDFHDGSATFQTDDDLEGNQKERKTLESPYLLPPSNLFRLKWCVWLSMLCGHYPWWIDKNCRIHPWNATMFKLWKICYPWWVLSCWIMTGYQVYSFIEFLQELEDNYRPIIQQSFSIFLYIYVLFYTLVSWYYEEDLRNYVNTLLHTNMTLLEKYGTTQEDWSHKLWVVNYNTITNTIQCVVAPLFYFKFPFQKWFLYHYIYEEGNNPWYWLLPGTIHEMMLWGHCIGGTVTLQWILAAHTTSAGLWLQEIHLDNETGRTKPEIREETTAFLIYRQLQILTMVFNNAMGPLGTISLKVVSTATVTCAYVLIYSVYTFIRELPGILMYPLACNDCVTITYVIVFFSAYMNDMADSFLNSWIRRKTPNFRVLRSCPHLCVKVRRFYSLKVSTVITFFRVQFDCLIDLLVTLR